MKTRVWSTRSQQDLGQILEGDQNILMETPQLVTTPRWMMPAPVLPLEPIELIPVVDSYSCTGAHTSGEVAPMQYSLSLREVKLEPLTRNASSPPLPLLDDSDMLDVVEHEVEMLNGPAYRVSLTTPTEPTPLRSPTPGSPRGLLTGSSHVHGDQGAGHVGDAECEMPQQKPMVAKAKRWKRVARRGARPHTCPALPAISPTQEAYRRGVDRLHPEWNHRRRRGEAFRLWRRAQAGRHR